MPKYMYTPRQLIPADLNCRIVLTRNEFPIYAVNIKGIKDREHKDINGKKESMEKKLTQNVKKNQCIKRSKNCGI